MMSLLRDTILLLQEAERLEREGQPWGYRNGVILKNAALIAVGGWDANRNPTEGDGPISVYEMGDGRVLEMDLRPIVRAIPDAMTWRENEEDGE